MHLNWFTWPAARFKVKVVLPPSVIVKVFDFCENLECIFRIHRKLEQPKINTTQLGTDSITNVGEKT